CTWTRARSAPGSTERRRRGTALSRDHPIPPLPRTLTPAALGVPPLNLGGTPNNAKESSMSDHHARIEWQRKSTDFTYATYNREHEWQFTAARVPASATKEYRGDANCVNPEEALVASLSSCHMLVFLAIAAKRKLSLDVYTDDAVGVLGKNADGK